MDSCNIKGVVIMDFGINIIDIINIINIINLRIIIIKMEIIKTRDKLKEK